MNLNRGTTFSPIALSTFGDATKKIDYFILRRIPQGSQGK
jgi:hypothetical protein